MTDSTIIDAILDTTAEARSIPAARTRTLEPDAPLDPAARARAEIAGAKLQEYLNRYAASGKAAAARVFREVPTDALVPAQSMRWLASDGKLYMGADHLDAQPLHPHAQQQAAERLGMHPRYLADLLTSGKDWTHALATHAMNEHSAHTVARYLVRSAGGSVRGVLSDSYRRLDSRPLLETFLVESEAAGMVVAAGISTDVRTTVKVVHPELVELPGGDVGIVGLNWANSDYGAGKYSVDAFVMRLLCLNGLVGENALASIHLGRRISDNAVVSQETIDLDTRTLQSATRDVIRGLRANGTLRDGLLDSIRQAAEAKISGDPIRGRVQTGLSSAEAKRARELFKGPEVVLLPPEPTRWRLSNVISWMANEQESGDRRIELERLAGEILDGRKARMVPAQVSADSATA